MAHLTNSTSIHECTSSIRNEFSSFNLIKSKCNKNNDKIFKSDEIIEDEEFEKNKCVKLIAYKENEEFVQRLNEFHRHRNVQTPLNQWPTLNGRPLDLHKLYKKVLGLGGWELVCEKNQWDEVGHDMDSNIDFSTCTNGSQALKTTYIRYLSLYEKFEEHYASINSLNPIAHEHFSNQQNFAGILNNSTNFFVTHAKATANVVDNERLTGDETTLGIINRRRFSYLIDSTPMSYNHLQHNLFPSTENIAVSIDLLHTFRFNPYKKIEQSLIAGLPNELDFVFNTLLILSSDEYHTFKIYSSPHLVELMLAHIGFFGTNNNNLGYRSLYDKVWQPLDSIHHLDEKKLFSNKYQRRNFVKFWHNAIQLPGYENSKMVEELLPVLYNQYLKTLPSHEVLNLHEDTIHSFPETNGSAEFKRIEQVLVTLLNLSFEENNADFMANKCSVLFEFLILCLYCDETFFELRNHALDTLSNLSRKLKIDKLNDRNRSLLLTSIEYLINGLHQAPQKFYPNDLSTINLDFISQERLDTIRGLEILTNLCSQKIDQTDLDDYKNEFIISSTESSGFFLNKILIRLEQLLSMQDIFILLNCLECLYHMTQFSEIICNIIVSFQSSSCSTPKFVSMLINILSVDMTHFGLQSNTHISLNQTNYPIKIYKIIPSNGIVTASTNSNNIQSSSTHPSTNLFSKSHQNPHSLLQQTLHNQHNLNTASSICSNSMNSVVKLNSNIQQLTQSNSPNKNSSGQEQNAKNVLCNWLRTCFQIDPSSEISKTNLYPYYQQIAKYKNWTVLTIPTFFELLNATFPSLRYNDTKIIGLKLVLNIKQQVQIKNDLCYQSNDKPKVVNNPVGSFDTQKIKNLLNPSLTNQTSGASDRGLVNDIMKVSSPKLPVPTSPPSHTAFIDKCAVTTSPIFLNLNEGEAHNCISIKQLDKYETIIKNEETVINSIKRRISNGSIPKQNKSYNEGIISTNQCTLNEFNSEETLEGENKLNKYTIDKSLNGIFKINEKDSRHNSGSSCLSTSSCASSSSSESEDINETKINFNSNKENNIILDELNKKRKLDDKLEVHEQINLNSVQIIDPNQVKLNSEGNYISNCIENSHFKKRRSVLNDLNDENSNTIDLKKTTADTNSICINSIMTSHQFQSNNQQQEIQYQSTPVNISIDPYQSGQNKINLNTTMSDTPFLVNNYVCEWDHCKKSFNCVKSIYNHVCKYHLLNLNNLDTSSQICQWQGCDQIKRQKWSLVNHIQERHCNEHALKKDIINSQCGLLSSSGVTNSSNLNYSKDAALMAIQRNQNKNNDEFIKSNDEGPLTKSIRLLSALTLRNLTRNSEKAKCVVKSYESVLTNVAFDFLESSSTIANTLWHLSN